MRAEILKCFDNKWKERYGEDTKIYDHVYWHVRKMIDESVHEGLVTHANDSQLKQHPSNTPLLSLMHDTAHELDTLRNVVTNMDKWNKEDKANTKYYVAAEYIRTARKNIMDMLDSFYLKQKSIDNTTNSTTND